MKYKLISTKCCNSQWCAAFFDNGEEKCECGFGCKLKIKHIESDYVFIVSESEYKKLVSQNEIAAEQSMHQTGLTPLQTEQIRQMIQSALDTGSA